MTAIITISCPQGIVMAADCRIVNTDDDGNVISTDPNPVEKIIKFEETNVGASFWGYYKGSEFCSSKTLNDIITEFDEGLWNATVEKVIIHSDNKLVFGFKDGREMDWDM